MAQYIYGKNLIVERIGQRKAITKIFLMKDLNDQKLSYVVKSSKISFEICERKVLDKLASGNKHQGIVAEIEDYKTVSVEDLLAKCKNKAQPLIVMLDQLEDPHNLGAILRTCDAIDADGVIFKKNNSVGLNATVAKVSTGAIETVPVCEVVNLSATLSTLKNAGFWVYGTDAVNSVDYRSPKYDTPVVLVIGSEGNGISQLVKKNCDQMINLPMKGSITSLNASVACAICLYEINSKRNPL